MRINRYVLRAAALHGEDIFKLADAGPSRFFVGQGLVDAWTTNGFVGLSFRQVDQR